MFGKKTGADVKEQKQSPRAALIDKIDQLAPGQQLM